MPLSCALAVLFFALLCLLRTVCGALCVCLFDNELNPKFIGLGFNFLATSKNVMRIHKYRVVCLRDGNSISRISMIKFQSPLNRLAPLHNYKHACMCVCVGMLRKSNVNIFLLPCPKTCACGSPASSKSSAQTCLLCIPHTHTHIYTYTCTHMHTNTRTRQQLC